jgi:ferredoxin--NADP+ reductase
MHPSEYLPGTSETCEATVVASKRITPDNTDEVRQLVLHVDEPAFYYPEGQLIGVQVQGPHPFGNKYHHRYYSIADARKSADQDGVDLELLVRRCFYIDEVSGEQYPGIASHHLCDARVGDRITLTGPYRSPFRIPADKSSHLLMVGTGTGIAPFRAFLRRIYAEQADWQGKVRLYYGALTGMDLLYMNDINSDLANYYDQQTFQAIQALRPNILGDEADALSRSLHEKAADILGLLRDPKTYVYLAGMKKAAQAFDAAMATASGGSEAWNELKQGLVEAKRWSELTYH